MKARLQLNIDQDILDRIKTYAASRNITISELVESYFRKIVQPPFSRKNILQLVAEMKKPEINPGADLKDLYYKEHSPSLP